MRIWGRSVLSPSRAGNEKCSQLEKWVREERLCFADDSPIGIPCENCGKTIKSGRYCEACKNTLANQLGSMYAINYEEDDEKDKNSRARMRYLDRK